jgi:hypothetical protein
LNYGCTALGWAFGAISISSFYTQSVGLLGREINPSQGLYLHTEQYKHRINAHNTDIHVLSGIRTHDPRVLASEGSSCLRPRGHCYRHVFFYIGRVIQRDDLLNVPACYRGPRVVAVTRGVFLPGEASNSCSKLDVGTREQKEFRAGTDGGFSCFFLLNQSFRSSGLHPATASKRKTQRETRIEAVDGATQGCPLLHISRRIRRVYDCNVRPFMAPRTVTLAELINMCKMESEFISTFRKS